MKKQKENSHEGITWSEMRKQNVQAEKVYCQGKKKKRKKKERIFKKRRRTVSFAFLNHSYHVFKELSLKVVWKIPLM